MSFGRLKEIPEAIRPHGTRTEYAGIYQPTFSKNPIPLPADRGEALRGSVKTKFLFLRRQTLNVHVSYAHGTIQSRIWLPDNCILDFNTQPRDDLDAHNAKIRVSNNYISSTCETMSPCLLAT
ncbi:uncharacterized protein CLUP02_08897 [Colletotrichum lupini]|uniref:Uncharacterized protein n=2 Tax=Colletotrichum acutatum species complex TaxID=2707335 RepID=A0A9Q8SVK0_9PEZI|nr:uncharacterized protein CLUP02_08897 [Colletotrichum lupini]XP_060304744.1 uncharacterized protein CCOS01_16472 [Colletotrichum costaricense]KAK1506420.1 hypothetical protein CCOS01_16472 [Colletotrichum costaricense]UQC83402.1 hypothetical protein CLUP02_08897 [Colletotrichum lupini]